MTEIWPKYSLDMVYILPRYSLDTAEIQLDTAAIQLRYG